MNVKSRTQRHKTILSTITLAAALWSCPSAVRCQPGAEAQRDIYANFVGTWVGSSRSMKDGVETTTNIRLTIDESKKRNGMDFKYEYGTKGQKGYARANRRITLRPSIPDMTSKWKGDAEKEHYTVRELDSFARNGLGVFYAATTGVDEKGKNSAYMCMFDLEKDSFTYRWERSEEGKAFEPFSYFSFTRESIQSVTH